MFGVLRPQRQTLPYRRLYARLCQHYRANYGLRAVFWLNYETLFLYAIASDLGLLPSASIKDQQCCRLRRDPALSYSSDHQLGYFLASIGLLLGSLKIDDDLRDEPAFASRLTNMVFRRTFRRARENLFKIDPELGRKLTLVIEAQAAMEAQKTRASLDVFCQPTVSGFIAIVDLLARQLNWPNPSYLTKIAAPIARAVVSFDQAMDFERDMSREGYTVLSGKADQLAALNHARRQIEEARSISSNWLGAESLADEILSGFEHRIDRLAATLQSPTAPKPWRPSLALFRTFYWTLFGLLVPASAMAADSDGGDGWCSFKTCCCFCLGAACGEGSSKARK
jgi:hypothetical protein